MKKGITAGSPRYISIVKTEIRNLKKLATVEEISKLDIDTFSPVSPHHCIYGQMTSSCHSGRALFLIKRCCRAKTSFLQLNSQKSVSVRPKCTGTYGGKTLSYLEHFIFEHKEHVANIMAYLKGETDTLEF